MCGIAGIFGFNAPPSEGSGGESSGTAAIVKAMRDTMVHRGPDGDGIWVSDDGRVGFGHRRLAIVDLTDAAAQPMSNEDGRVWVTFNGEIYNHLALRQKLTAAGHTFRTDHSDTEVLVHGYEEWGIDGLVERLDGMFAFAIWDEGEQRLTLVRDRVGIKPLYFTRPGGSFLFASEIKGLLAHGQVTRAMEPAALNHFLSFLVAPAPLTMFKDIFKLPPAHILEVDAKGRLSARRYWDATPGRGINGGDLYGLSESETEKYYTKGIRRLLESAIEKRMMSDVPFGVFLSGGIDSSANVGLMSRLMDRPVDTFTVGFKDHQHLNELDQAARVAKEFKTNHHEVLIDEQDMIGYLDDLVHHQDEPIADWVCIPLYFVSKLAKDSGVTVVQVGEGSDEQFCGYDSYMTYLNLYRKFWNPYRALTPGPLRGAVGGVASMLAGHTDRYDKFVEVLRRAGAGHDLFYSGANAFWSVHKDRLLPTPIRGTGWQELAEAGLDTCAAESPDSGDVIQAFLGPFDKDHPGSDDLNRMSYAEFRLRLPELLLMRVDKISMSTSVEGRVPFLDHHLVEFTADIPQSWKIRGGETKYLLKKALGDLLPDDIIHRKKMGFAAPMTEWLRGDFGRRAERTVMESGIFEYGLLDREHVTGLFRDHLDGRRDHALHLWALFNLAAWHDHWIAGRSA